MLNLAMKHVTRGLLHSGARAISSHSNSLENIYPGSGPQVHPPLTTNQKKGIPLQTYLLGLTSHHLDKTLDGPKVTEFNSKLSSETRKQNTEAFNELIETLLSLKSQRKLMEIIKSFLSSQRSNDTMTANPHEKQLFKKIYDLFLDDLKEIYTAREMIKRFSECSPKLIKICDTDRKNESEKWMDYFHNEKITKMEINIRKTMQMPNVVKEPCLPLKNETLDFLDSLGKVKSMHQANTKSLKLHFKREPLKKELQTDQPSLERQKSLFGNKKIETDRIMLKKVGKHIREQHKNYGQNWVYAYDLPYQLSSEKARHFINVIANKYGDIQEYHEESYKNFIELNRKQWVMQVPENYRSEDSRSTVRMGRVQVMKTEKVKEKKNVKVPKTTKMLQRVKKQRELSFNKSTMLFKFKNKEDKVKFLSPEMRLYGLCIQNIRNARFEEAQSKNVVVLSMIPEACQSADLLKFINGSLAPLNVSVTHPNCIIASGYLFIEFDNFYQAVHSKDMLNNLQFQDQRIKAQLCYGSSYVYEGQYRYNFESDHYEELLERLTAMRNKQHNLMMV